ncbi:tRNA sulfurtransferase ThiI [Thermoclostridium stercorarium subsp. stercorarium DSM 8532]|uniref:Probable tRNA sulfurtransferase n=3 Tax=Thermoclostridium stercorarium TaxID=1510 RepID=L7VJP2_THES1|nr:tRNA uracil 4-sulfurtransferase ThiI [Thermoclostridium stercorarium]AGC68330.1 tRNA sulfurtransferase ThiI [Thermoclostridium stercorarium subsp. stercorarium DSM 8532]AGI39354.1 ThiI [Thermoclostridium stercorarium subsp. stercorarium DSM 8532]ANW98675.1 tRNA sulfurtransferase ThiI [Thermoclostridium stercorarium subsp. thermolacticum DSM 2910]ANX01216.1 tRNA sulfurtransferase ThiI [Thermoclostridium stercorarium subsp. leptospartum DSM 9219]UZQ86836.1 tRNA 4-thiouridine(8) synthase ThiI 
MKTIILVRYEEIFLKGLNKPSFEAKLVKNMKHVLKGLGPVSVTRSQSRIYVEPETDDYPVDEAIKRLTKVFGIASVSPVYKIESDINAIYDKAVELSRKIRSESGYKTFKVETKRADKKFPLSSMEVSREAGAAILRNVRGLKVDVNNPDFVVHIEIRDNTYIYSEIIPGVKGLPVGSSGKATLLISGGIDSPVAGWMMAKRGVKIEGVHFFSYPYTSEKSKEKVIRLCKILSEYNLGMRLYIVPFTDIQLAINQNCPHEYLTIIMRRFMMRIAEKIAVKNGSLALVTGEAVGQVASQTPESILVTNSAVTLPVYRPCIGMDKSEVVDIARKIGTFETSILPYEDCCTVFVARHPVTKPKLEKTIEYESVLNADELIQKALEGTEVIDIE